MRGKLTQAYSDLAAAVSDLDEAATWLPSGCAGWAVRDLVFHVLSDVQRALVAMATPAEPPADRDLVSYWQTVPGGNDPQSRGLRSLRMMASAWTWEYLQTTFSETIAAALVAASRTDADSYVATQGHVLRADDLFATLAVEAAVHHLDLIKDLPALGPSPTSLALARRTVDGLLGRPTPTDWDDAEWVLCATGRRALAPEQRAFLGDDIDRLPLLS